MASLPTTTSEKSPAVSPRRRPKGAIPSSSMDDSSDSDGDEEVSKALHRRVSTSKQLKNKVGVRLQPIDVLGFTRVPVNRVLPSTWS